MLCKWWPYSYDSSIHDTASPGCLLPSAKLLPINYCPPSSIFNFSFSTRSSPVNMLMSQLASKKLPLPSPLCQVPSFPLDTRPWDKLDLLLSPHFTGCHLTTPRPSFCPSPSCTYCSGQGLEGLPCCQNEGTPFRPYLHPVASLWQAGHYIL